MPERAKESRAISHNKPSAASGFSHEKVETSNFLMVVLILLVIAIGGLVEILPLFFQKSTTEAVKGVLPYDAMQVAGEFVYDHPFQWGSKRTGPDLHRVGGRYSDEWHRIHLNNPRDVVPESNMPAYPWLEKTPVDPSVMAPRMRALRTVGVPYTDAQIDAAAAEVKGKSEQEALIAYLQVLGLALK